MQQVHILITERQLRLLREESAVSGLSMSELVRRALDKTYRPRRRPRFKGFELAVSVSKPPNPAGIGRRDNLI